jgi:hypothetical protein
VAGMGAARTAGADVPTVPVGSFDEKVLHHPW